MIFTALVDKIFLVFCFSGFLNFMLIWLGLPENIINILHKHILYFDFEVWVLIFPKLLLLLIGCAVMSQLNQSAEQYVTQPTRRVVVS